MAALIDFRVFFTVIFSVLCVFNAVDGRFMFSHLPEYVDMNKAANEIKTSEIPGTLSLMMGFSPNKDIEWNGLIDSNPFKRPSASVSFTVESSTDLNPKSTAAFETNTDIPFVSVEPLSNHIQKTFSGETPLIVDITGDHMLADIKNTFPMVFKDLPISFDEVLLSLHKPGSIIDTLGTKTLNRSRKPDSLLLAELQSIFHIITALKSHSQLIADKTPDIYNFEIKGLSLLEKEYGVNSQQVKDAKRLIEKFFEKATQMFRDLYKDNVVVSVISLPTADPAVVRKSRSLMATVDPTPAPKPEQKLNLAGNYGHDYPVMFNIILWLMIVLAITIFSIATCMWHMDPGRDSIIYRMTNTRMKKE